jgi:hypothetical protein
MRKIFAAILSVTLCAQPVAVFACGELAYGPKLRGFQKLGIELDQFQQATDVYEFYGLKNGAGAENSVTTFETIKDPSGKYHALLTATETGTADDSIAARQWRFAMNKKGSMWVLKTAGERWKCARGKNTVKWTTKRCP